jgi:hypothetical protein
MMMNTETFINPFPQENVVQYLHINIPIQNIAPGGATRFGILRKRLRAGQSIIYCWVSKAKIPACKEKEEEWEINPKKQ